MILIISFQSRCFAINIVTSLNGGNCSLVTAENNTILNQNESLIVKSLTKSTKTKKIFIREEIDGFRYFLLQDKYGLIGVMSKGSRNMKSKLRSVSRKMIYGTFHVYYKKDGLSTLIGVDVINAYSNILLDLERVSYASYMMDLVMQVFKQNDESDQ